MESFKDSKGRVWTIEINVAVIKKIKGTLNLDLMNIELDSVLGRLAGDIVLLVDALWLICESQAKADGIDDVAFASRLSGDSLDDATQAFIKELISFFPQRRRDLLQLAWTKAQEVETHQFAKAMEHLKNLDVSDLTSGS